MTSQPYRRPSAHLTLTVNRHDLEWLDRAPCRQTDPEVFFPTSEEGPAAEFAKSICIERCTVRQECLNRSLLSGDEFGVFGGLTSVERRRVLVKALGGAA